MVAIAKDSDNQRPELKRARSFTNGYMSPEQARGDDADQRSDIFSFGCIFYELLSGRRAFEGETTSDMLANILKSDVDLSRLPPSLDPRLVEILTRCLEKNPRAALACRRRRSHASSKRSWTGRRPQRSRARPLTDVVAALEMGGGGRGHRWSAALTAGYARVVAEAGEPIASVTRLSIPLPEGQQFSNVGRPIVALSPDGTNVIYVANRRLYLRPLSGYESRAIPGSEHMGAILNPVFSPDGQSVAFASVGDAALKRMPISGGAAVTICTIDALFGLSWSEQGILFGQPKGVLRVSPDGGTPDVVVVCRRRRNGRRSADAAGWKGGAVLDQEDGRRVGQGSRSSCSRWEAAFEKR